MSISILQLFNVCPATNCNSRCNHHLWRPKPRGQGFVQPGHKQQRRCKCIYILACHWTCFPRRSFTNSRLQIFARENITLCEDNYSDILRSYCDTGDTYCDQGDVRAVHGGYVEEYGDKVADFVVKQYESAAGDSSATATVTTTAVTASVTATTTQTEDATAAASATETETASTVPDSAASGLAPGFIAAAAVPLVLAIFEMAV